MSEQIPYQEFEFAHDPATDFALNPEARCPVVLLLDTSYSMSGQPITELNEGLGAFKSDVETDSLASKRVEVATVTFGPVEVSSGFTTISDWQPPALSAYGVTPMGEAIQKAIAMVNVRKAEYRKNGVKYYRPWIILITDGAPTDNWQRAGQEVRDGENSKNFAFFAVGVAGADMGILSQISVRTPLALQGLKFRELFQWLSSSMRSVSQSVPGTEVSIPAPTGWASV